MSEARRRPSRALLRQARRARHPFRRWIRSLAAAALAVQTAFPVAAEAIVAARYDEPTGRYPHGVLGDGIEYGALVLDTDAGRVLRLRLPETRVFEDTAPRLVDLDGDGAPEVVVVESHASRGARLAVYGPGGRIAATDWIGRRFRWLAPMGAADLDGDGRSEIAYVDRPHLARILRVVRFEDGNLTPVAALAGVTNHRIGEADIAGGIRDCGGGPEMILADAGWTRLLAVRLEGGSLSARDIGVHDDRGSFAAALACGS